MSRWLLAPPAAFIAVAFLWPLGTVLAAATDPSAWAWATGPVVTTRIVGALWMATLSMSLTLLTSIPLAILYHVRRFPATHLHLALHAAPFVLPVFVIVFGIQTVLGTDGWTHTVFGLDALHIVGPLGAVVIAHAYYNHGFATRLIHAALERRPRHLEAAAQVLGASPRAAAWRVTVPLLWPAIASAALLVFLFSFSSFGVVLFMGGTEVKTLEVLLYENLRGAFARPERAAVLGVVQLLIMAATLLAYQWLIRRQTPTPRRAHESPAATPGLQAMAWCLVGLGLLPALSVLVGGFQVGGQWSLEAWRALLDPDHAAHLPGFALGRAIGLSLFYAACSATIAVALTACFAYGLRASSRWATRFAELIAALPLGTSSLLIGFGLIQATSVAFAASAGRLIIIAAHALVAFPFAARALLPAIRQHDHRLDEAAALLGAPGRSIVWRIHRPMLAGSLAAAIGISVAMSLGDFGASLLLMTADDRGLSVWIAAHGGTASFNPLVRAQAVALSGLLMVLAVAGIAVARVEGE